MLTIHNLTINDIAELLDLSTAFKGLVEREDRGIKIIHLLKLCRLYNVSLDYLYGPQATALIEDNRYIELLAILETYSDSEIYLLCSILRGIKSYKNDILN